MYRWLDWIGLDLDFMVVSIEEYRGGGWSVREGAGGGVELGLGLGEGLLIVACLIGLAGRDGGKEERRE